MRNEADINRALQMYADTVRRICFMHLNNLSDVERFVGPEVTATTDKILHKVRDATGSPLGDNIRCGIAIHLRNAILRIRQGQPIEYPNLEKLRQGQPELFQLALSCLQIVEQDFNIRFPQDEAGFLALFFVEDKAESRAEPVQVIVIAHGTGTATGMAETANRLINTNLVRGFDAPLEESPIHVYERVREYIAASPNTTDVLLLVDMGSLGSFAEDLERDLHIRARRFILVSTLHVLEAGRKASMGYFLDDIFEAVKGVNKLALSDINSFEEPANRGKLYLLAVCTTGEGGARVIRDFLCSRLNLQDGLCEIATVAAADPNLFEGVVKELRQEGRIVCVVSAFATGLSVPHFELVHVFDESCIGQIQSLIDTESAFVQVERTLIPMLEYINGELAFRDIRAMIERVEAETSTKLEEQMQIGVFCHVGCLLDKLKRGEPAAPFHRKDQITETYPDEVAAVERECARLAAQYDVVIPWEEICRIAAFFVKADILGIDH